MMTSLSAMSRKARNFPTMQGWNRDDGAFMVHAYPKNSGEMDDYSWPEWWNRFRDHGFNDERDKYFNLKNYKAKGSNTAAFMAASDVLTTADFMCGVH